MHIEKITTIQQLEQAFTIRKKVFVEEQQVPEEEELDSYDVLDGECQHVLLTKDHIPVGTGRVRLVDNYGKLQRVAILKEYRKFGFGKVIIAKLEQLAAEQGATNAKLDAQVHAIGFYEKLGYSVQSEVFMDAGIEHVLMTKIL
ncbi:MAG: GNAT family N-acetyltransferase [Kurthia sp.]|nr:GNAT family N-acetyltransferase [Candidatus Kurthia equi]